MRNGNGVTANTRREETLETADTIQQPCIGQFIIQRLQEYGIGHVFGIPGDYVLTFYDMLQRSPIRVVNTTREDAAGYAADAYARVHGMGALCVTYCVGGLSVANAAAQAYAEKSPVVVLTGSPGLNERRRDPLLHHKVRNFTTQVKIFEEITCASTVLSDPVTAFGEIDRVLEACWQQKRPVYIEIPRDMVEAKAPTPYQRIRTMRTESDSEALAEAIAETAQRLNTARHPVILADVEIHRFCLQKELLKLLEKTNIPFATTILGKSVVSELHPLYLGLYEGVMGRPEPTKAVESSDCLLMLGTFLTDINLGIFTARLDRARTIEATSEKVQISHHAYTGIRLKDFIEALLQADIHPRKPPEIVRPTPKPYKPKPNTAITVIRLFERLNELLTDNMTVISDVGDCLFGSVDLTIHKLTEFVSPAYYTSMGFAVPAALGAQCGSPKSRHLVLVGDGAFQMTGMELSSIVREGFNPIVIVLNNHGYTTERFIKEGDYNNIQDWRFEKIPEVVGGGKGYVVRTEEEFEQAWQSAIADREQFSILNVLLEKMDHSLALERLGRKLAAKLKAKHH